MSSNYPKKMRGQVYQMLAYIWPDNRVGISPGGYQVVPLRHWSHLLHYVRLEAGVFRFPNGRNAEEQIEKFIQTCSDDEFETILGCIPRANIEGGGAEVTKELNEQLSQFEIPLKVENGKVTRLSMTRNPPGENYRPEDHVPDTIRETEKQLAHYYNWRRKSMEGSIQRDEMDAKIQELENNLRRLGGNVTGTSATTDHVQGIIAGFRAKRWLAALIVIVLIIIVIGNFTSALKNISDFVKGLF